MKRFHSSLPARSRGFTLVELLTVLAIIVILSALAVPAITSLKKANELNLATTTIATLLDQARSHAMANNTYVFVCIAETDASLSPTQTQTAGTGRVAMQVFSSTDGTLNLGTANLTPIIRPQIFNNLDLPSSLTATTGTLPNRSTSTAVIIVGSTSFPAASSSVVSGNFIYSKIFAFDSRGGLHLPSTPPQSGLQYIEIDLQQSNGAAVPAAAHDLSAIQIDGLTGNVTTYRS